MAGAKVIYLPAVEIPTATVVPDCRTCPFGEPWQGDVLCSVAQDVVFDPIAEARDCPEWVEP